jgi:tagatose-1,6-bisphosphate aldolase non-catalytic subunit AgaZ/GatZ
MNVHNQVKIQDFISGSVFTDPKATLLGVGPVTEATVEAAFSAASRTSSPPIFIASRNQVDIREFGGGYLMGGMDQYRFTELIRHKQEEIGYNGPVFICRDHGGPWQRNAELDNAYPVEKALEIARKSFKHDILAGFNYLHIDPTKCPHQFSMEDLIDWTVQLLQYCEEVRKETGIQHIEYEVGAEDIQGGLTEPSSFKRFLSLLTEKLKELSLPLPTCIVGQTGTLVRMDRNVGRFDRELTAQLVQIAHSYGMGFKEHNGDYLSGATCRIHPQLGIDAMNVAPEFGVIETDALLHLSDLEDKLIREGWVPSEQGSRFREILQRKTFEQAPWKKWMTDDIKQQGLAEIRDDTYLRLLIARVSGHYVLPDAEVRKAQDTMLATIDSYKLLDRPAAEYVREQVTRRMVFYIDHFQARGINERLT